jgi:cell wall-associated NlpC family hydrolase
MASPRGTVTHATFKYYRIPVTEMSLTRTRGAGTGEGWSLRKARKPRNKLSGRRWLRLAIASGLLVMLSAPVGLPRLRLDGNPSAPSQAQINAAENRVKQQQAALGAQQGQLSAANAQLSTLQVQAEVLTQRYDQTLVNEQRAAAAYKVTQARLGYAQQAQAASQRELAGLAEQEFESGGGFGPMSSMLGNASGPQGYLSEVGLGQVLAQNGTDTEADAQANDVVDAAFRKQAHDLLAAQQADVQAASHLKLAVEAAVDQQQAFVSASKAKRNTLAQQVADAQAHAAALKSARQAALAAAAAAAAAKAAAAATASTASSSATAPSWASSSGASATQGDIAANWALTQLGKPYQWGAVGPDTYDCSGLTMEAWVHAGVALLHYTGYQWEEGPYVSLNDLQRGDLLFYATDNSDPATIHHVGIYIGNGMMVDAPYTGADVRVDSIYQPGDPIGAVRPAG